MIAHNMHVHIKYVILYIIAKRISMDEVTSNSVEPPATISCSAPLLCSSSDMMWSVEGTGSSDDTNQLESSLDRGTRQHHYTELSNEVESSLDIRKRYSY